MLANGPQLTALSGTAHKRFANPTLQLARETVTQGYRMMADERSNGDVSTEVLYEYLVANLGVADFVARQTIQPYTDRGVVTHEQFFALFDEELERLDDVQDDERGSSGGGGGDGGGGGAEGAVEQRRRAGVRAQLWVLCKRTVVQKLRAYDSTMTSLSVMAAFGLLVGGLLGSEFQPFQRSDTQLTLMMTLIMAIMVRFRTHFDSFGLGWWFTFRGASLNTRIADLASGPTGGSGRRQLVARVRSRARAVGARARGGREHAGVVCGQVRRGRG